jgi:hypothetical protein
MSKENQMSSDNNRRNFLKMFFSLAGTAGLIATVNANATDESTEKIKMLTADGKLVEVKKSKIMIDADSKIATNKEVSDWMGTTNTPEENGR